MAMNQKESASRALAAEGTGGTVLDFMLPNGTSSRVVIAEARVQEERVVLDAVELLASEAVRKQLEKESPS